MYTNIVLSSSVYLLLTSQMSAQNKDKQSECLFKFPFLNNTHIIHKYLSDENKWFKTKPNPLFNSWNKRDNTRKNHQLMTTSWNCNTKLSVLLYTVTFDNSNSANMLSISRQRFCDRVHYTCLFIGLECSTVYFRLCRPRYSAPTILETR